ncbi:beta-1,4 N-acetylgalactosaminyltransferase 1-like [Branchiostoma floridae]|uniref:Beta-1,4 N-acetylgalactosaminyltransferase 1-like n=1 Tax=Branchiostoma floridae TaxID=7739 RepID=A0A9J7N4A0_BRAFL|nr:beta-1,4 N-acetylgalactosaminyltransferase 1-like [Branchiostoma floridae]XP_035689056.1 beta-1,4 N-acetylgalactosaminyltransferase 1-like [Branchiostoma floridae]XP_035689057.1 beta-1,4 N-acetylgalactosaminyltransferase 1-like [Branchiostoma floridae]XP_035689058.1 beta-1,4 N-acetylgalactosaminyltransferase 1-like [Branchiostoma floridae]XP_035689059.1 beta-1,4 N-acetylgalactosaminyltransferase 1-like [Branchiostoma floridae]
MSPRAVTVCKHRAMLRVLFGACLSVFVVMMTFNLFLMRTVRAPADLRYIPAAWRKGKAAEDTKFPWEGGDLQDVPFAMKKEVLQMVANEKNCSCPDENPLIKLTLHPFYHPPSSAYLSAVFNQTELRDVVNRKYRERDRLKQRAPPQTPLLFADGRSPLSYPTQGLRVQPRKSTIIPGLKLRIPDEKVATYTVEFIARLGVLTTLADVPGVAVDGAESTYLSLTADELTHLNRQLQFIVYTNTYFDPDTVDYVEYRYGGFVGVIPIQIHYKPMLQAFNYVDDDIASKVTVATKTFLRYDKLRHMIDSVRQFYPTITIIIADDSEHPEKVEGQNIEHYTMPFNKGWFAGRNLAVSQVTTPYFLWVDDDFIFTAETRIDLLLKVIENTNLDIVGGGVYEELGIRNSWTQKIRIEDGDELGDCMFQTKGYYHKVEGFPECVVADVVINFFLGDTAKVRSVGFDPQFARIGHEEFFLDGLGKLRVASCSHVSVSHTSKMPLPWKKSKLDLQYRSFRDKPESFKYKQLFYKFNLKCIHLN